MRKFFNILVNTTFIEKKLFVSSLFWMYFYAIYLRIIPSKIWINQKSRITNNTKKSRQLNLLQLKRALLRAGKCYIFQNQCLVQSLAGKKILSNYHIQASIHLGLKSKEKFIAHAWLCANGIEIIEKNDDYTEILKIE